MESKSWTRQCLDELERCFRASPGHGGNGFSPVPERFYDFKYQPMLREMVAFVIRKEGPIFADLLITRIARAHGFARSGGKIRETIMAAIDPKFPTSKQGELTLLWPEGLVQESIPYRHASPDVRSLWDIPDVELMGLARRLLEKAISSDYVLPQMIERLRISRVTEGTRRRLAEIISRCAGMKASDGDKVVA